LALPALARAQAAPLKIRFGWAITPAQFLPVIFENTAVLKHYGKSYVTEAYYFKGSAPQITALAAGGWISRHCRSPRSGWRFRMRG